MTQLCASIVVHTVEQALAGAARAAETGADLVEFRIDMVSNPQIVADVVKRSIVPCIVTCRPESEGGESAYDDDYRLKLLKAGADAGAAYCDIELATLMRNPGATQGFNSKLIASHHDFKGRPSRLYNLIDELNAVGAITKIAWMPRSIRDNIEAFELLQNRPGRTIALCMGEAGLISRILGKKFGAFLTFASLEPERSTAPGQPTIEQLKRLYRWDSIGQETKVFGVVGSPIAHSLSPSVHNAAFDATGFDGVYVPMLVEPSYESFKAFMVSFADFAPLHLRGLSITIPHKENAFRYLQEVGAEIDPWVSETIRAVNTIKIEWIDGQPRLKGSNTDYHAIIEVLCDALNEFPEDLDDYRIAVIGAGGTARTAVAALAGLGATVVIYNRSMDQAEVLSQEFNGRTGRVVAARLEKLCDSCCHIYINCTPVGMQPKVDESPLGDRTPAFTAETLVFDTIYNPPQTRLLKQAEAAGARTVGGEAMFIKQAAEQFRLWTSTDPPIDAMRQAMRAGLLR